MKKRKTSGKYCSGCRTSLLRWRDDERGAVAVIVMALLVVLIGFAALVIDLGMLFVVRGELQNAADSGALAGLVELSFSGQDGGEAVAVAYATQPGNFHLTNPAPGADAVDVNVSGTQYSGSNEQVRVQIRRAEGTAAGPVPVIFARIWGIETVDVVAVAVARRERRIIGMGPGNLMPFSIHEDMVDSDGDGDYDIGNSIDIYPLPWSPGNFGLLDLDGGSNSNAETADWIENGYDGIFIIPENPGYLNVEGDPGISGGSLNGAISLRVGQPVLFPIFDQVTEQGANTIYRVVDLVGGIITGFQLTGAISNRHFTLQISEFSATNLVVGSENLPLNSSVSAAVLVQ